MATLARDDPSVDPDLLAWLEQLDLPCFIVADDQLRWGNAASRKLTGRDIGAAPIALAELRYQPAADEPLFAADDLAEICLSDAAGSPVLMLMSRNHVAVGGGGAVELAICFPIGQQLEARRHADLVLRETQHRSRNMMSIVAAIAARAFAGVVADDKLRDFVDRLRSLDAALRASCDVAEDRCSLHTVVKRVTDRFHQPGDARIHLLGEEVEVSPGLATRAGLILHELCTNATKHGALRGHDGVVTITLRHVAGAAHDVVFEWRELGGPPVVPPSATGSGLQLIERLGTHSSCDVTLRFPTTGVFCRVAFASGQADAGSPL